MINNEKYEEIMRTHNKQAIRRNKSTALKREMLITSKVKENGVCPKQQIEIKK